MVPLQHALLQGVLAVKFSDLKEDLEDDGRMRRTHWSLTVHQPAYMNSEVKFTEEEMIEKARALRELVMQNLINDPRVRYVVIQVEKGELTKRIHLQGYVQLKRRVRRPQMIKMCGFGKAFETAITARHQTFGYAEDMRNYAMKEDTQVLPPLELGTWKKPSGGNFAMKDQLGKVHDWCIETQTPMPGFLVLKYHPRLFAMYHGYFENRDRAVERRTKYERSDGQWWFKPSIEEEGRVFDFLKELREGTESKPKSEEE